MAFAMSAARLRKALSLTPATPTPTVWRSMATWISRWSFIYRHKRWAAFSTPLGLRVQTGERFKAGDLVSRIYEDCDIRLDAFEETGRTVLRAVIPDKHNRFLEDEQCMDAYRVQLLRTEDLYEGEGIPS